MKRTAFTLLGFLLGGAVAIAVIANPLQWGWLHPVQHRVAGMLAGDTAESPPGQIWTCSMHPEVRREAPGNCPICGMPLTLAKEQTAQAAAAGERRILYWQAPMDPSYTSDQPGKSPMGMDLVPVYEDEAGAAVEPGLVAIDPAFVQSIGVRTTPVQAGDIPASVRTVGTLRYDEEQIAVVTTRFEGWVENVRAQYVGQSVERGDVLFDLYSPQMVATQKEYLDALVYRDQVESSGHQEAAGRAASLVASIRQRLGYWDVTDAQIGALARRGAVERTVPVTAPASGIIIAKAERSLEGLFARPGMNLYEIADLSTIWVEAEVFEHQIPLVRVGQRARIDFPSLDLPARAGTVRYLHPSLDAQTRTLKVSIEVPNPDLRLRADMFADISFNVSAAAGVLTVPEEAVLLSGRRYIVIVDRGAGRFEPREVIVGAQGQGRWEIRQGLREGEQVVVSSQFLIDSESNLREAIRKIAAASTSPAEHQH